MRIQSPILLIAALLLCASTARSQQPADGVYYTIPIDRLTIVNGALPEHAMLWNAQPASQQPRVILEPPAVAIVWAPATNGRSLAGSVPLRSASLFVHLPRAVDELSGTLLARGDDRDELVPIRFTARLAGMTSSRTDFLSAQLAQYRSLANQNIPGAAWFRFQERKLAAEVGETPADQANRAPRVRRPAEGPELDRTFALFDGSRAMSENLQLDRALPPTAQSTEAMVPIDEVFGITVAEMDWTALTKDLKPQLDPLASLIPADQHAVFFPSFESITQLIDRAEQHGSLLPATSNFRSEDAMTRQRYERQLCLSLTGLGRLLGPRVINSVAVTGSDPYLVSGTDLALIFEARSIDTLAPLITAQIALARQANPAAQSVSGQIDGIAYTGALSPDRNISSYQATVGNAVVVTNSLAQLAQIVAAHQKKTPNLTSTPEYTFFRDRYRREDQAETALLILSDATIRRWCGPRWRIADSRRTRAAAVLADLHAQYAAELVNKTIAAPIVAPARPVPDLGELRLTAAGATSSTYGHLQFMTPIRELQLQSVTKPESIAYGMWRNNYQLNWSNYFDPIACRFALRDNHIGIDVTVMPLIASTSYREFISVTEGATLKAGAADPHAEALAQLALAVNPDSDTFRGYGKMLQNILGNLRIEPLAWVGSAISIYADEDPFWAELAAVKPADASDFIQKNIGRLPIALYVESRDSLRLAAFVTAARAFVEQSAPGLTRWESQVEGDRQFVRITPVDERNMPGMAIYYAATPRAFILTFNRSVLLRAMDRLASPSTRPSTAPALAWLGQSAAVRVAPRGIERLESIFRSNSSTASQMLAWGNIPILNEWKRLFPDKDPIEVHQQLFQTRLQDPAGGTYTWNAGLQTMESTHYGHPAAPKSGAALPDLIRRFSGEFGLTFENKGVRARVEIDERK